MILYMMALAALILLILLYRYLPNKKIFACFCLTLAAAGLIVYYVWPRPEPPKTALSESEQWERSQQQQIFAAWYAGRALLSPTPDGTPEIAVHIIFLKTSRKTTSAYKPPISASSSWKKTAKACATGSRTTLPRLRSMTDVTIC